MLINKKIISLFGCLTFVCFFMVSEFSYAYDQTVTDSKITLQVKTKLFVEKGVPSTKINIETHNGVVFMSGVLPSTAQATSAIEAIQSLEEVKDVDVSDLRIEGSEKPLADIFITAKIKGLLIKKIFIEKTAYVKY